MTPNRVEPSTIDSSTTAACRSRLRPCSHGSSTLPSSCCTTRTLARMMSAATHPLDTSATSTARAPTVTAPMMGAKAAKKVSRASGMASGTPTTTRPAR